MRETTVENYLTKRARALGGDTFKIAPTHRGIPDRLVLLPNGVMALCELKAPTGRLSPAQVEWHRRAAQKGTKVYVCYSKDDVDHFLEAISHG